jgi:preprotein translocase subunit YajC
MITLLLAQAQTTAPATPGIGGGLGGFIVPMTLMLVIMYFLMIRPQRKRQADQKRLIDSMKTGDKVVTNAGIHGLISNVKDTTVIVKVADNVKIEMEKSAVATVIKADS